MQSNKKSTNVQKSTSDNLPRDPRPTDTSSPSDQLPNPPWIVTGIYIGLRRGQERIAS
uniref:hypothetical protein n=1 Tax=Azospirillum argentinense TaxID=2970906 RepID=UPI0015866151|nr:hypothetical protein [Azospirillum argentinense]